MDISFDCPKCGKPYDLPWSMAGKKARCKRCEVEFVIPAPFEAKGPKSSEAIPVFDPKAAALASAGPRPIKAQDPPPNQLLVALRTGKPARTMKMEAPRPNDRLPSPAPSREPEERHSAQPSRTVGPRLDDPLFPATPGSPPPLERSRTRREQRQYEADPPEDLKAPPKRPPWMIPAIVIADLAIVLINVGLISSLVGGDDDDDDDAQPAKVAPAKSVGRKKPRVDDVPERVARPREADKANAAPAKTRKRPVTQIPDEG